MCCCKCFKKSRSYPQLGVKFFKNEKLNLIFGFIVGYIKGDPLYSFYTKQKSC